MSLHTVGILTISDTAHKDPSSDTAGPFLRTQLESHPSDGFRVVTHAIVADDPVAIAEKVREWVDKLHVSLCITIGGTGFGMRDGTREALEPLITKPTPALSHTLTSHSLNKTPFAALSRPLTGIRQTQGHGTPGSLIITLPGSQKAVKECLEILIGDGNSNGILLHALDLITGGNGKKVHRELQGQGGGRDGNKVHSSSTEKQQLDNVSTATDTGKAHSHSHSHSDHHHHRGHHAPKPRTLQKEFLTLDPNAPTSQRHRQSPYPIIPLSEALDLITHRTPSPSDSESGSLGPIALPTSSKLVSHVLAEDVKASRDLPPGPTTNVDGYAVAAADTPPGEYNVVTSGSMTQNGSNAGVKKGEVFRINTGQGLPKGTDSVVMVEDTELVSSTESSILGIQDESKIKVLAQVDQGENVRPTGSDVKQGAIVLNKGTVISSLGGEIGTLAFLGRKEALVYRKPKVAILSTGNELVDLSSTSSSINDSSWGFPVFDANRPSLKAAVEAQGFEVLDLGVVGDEVQTTVNALKRGVNEADVLITTGGTSMGESDLLKPLIERELKGTIHFGRVAMKPGKPTTFATVASTSGQDKLVFALPGNPASALVCFYVFVLPSLRKLAGYAASPPGSNSWSSPRVKVSLAQSMRLDPRPEFHRVVVKVETGKLAAYSTGNQRSSGMHSMATANALVCVPAKQPSSPQHSLEAGSEVEAIILGQLY